jgi:hypothetical protein
VPRLRLTWTRRRRRSWPTPRSPGDWRLSAARSANQPGRPGRAGIWWSPRTPASGQTIGTAKYCERSLCVFDEVNRCVTYARYLRDRLDRVIASPLTFRSAHFTVTAMTSRSSTPHE